MARSDRRAARRLRPAGLTHRRVNTKGTPASESERTAFPGAPVAGQAPRLASVRDRRAAVSRLSSADGRPRSWADTNPLALSQSSLKPRVPRGPRAISPSTESRMNACTQCMRNPRDRHQITMQQQSRNSPQTEPDSVQTESRPRMARHGRSPRLSRALTWPGKTTKRGAKTNAKFAVCLNSE